MALPRLSFCPPVVDKIWASLLCGDLSFADGQALFRKSKCPSSSLHEQAIGNECIVAHCLSTNNVNDVIDSGQVVDLLGSTDDSSMWFWQTGQCSTCLFFEANDRDRSKNDNVAYLNLFLITSAGGKSVCQFHSSQRFVSFIIHLCTSMSKVKDSPQILPSPKLIHVWI
jgi:hypothetical protein